MKYKLIKEYPGSPKLNTIVENHEKLNSANTLDKRYYYNGMKIQDYPEFWEEIVEKDYEILSFVFHNCNKTISSKRKNGLFVNSDDVHSDGKYTEESHFNRSNNPLWKIYSVKRLSDGEIFTIGDKIETGIIKKFYLPDVIQKEITIYVTEDDEDTYLSEAVKLKQPLFTTEDGVDIFEGNNHYFYIDKNWWIDEIHNINKLNYKTYHKGKPLFSTKEKAKEYILMNKPCLSINDIINSKAILDTFGKLELEKLVQQKLNK